MNTNTNTNGLDDLRREALSRVREFGRAAASGEDARPACILQLIEDCQNGVLSPDDNKEIYDQYLAAYSKRAVFTENGKAGNASKWKAPMSMGAMVGVDGVAVAQRAVTLRGNMASEGLKPKAMFDGLVSVSRAQLANPSAELSDDEIRDALSKDVKEKSAKDFLKSAAKALEKALEINDGMGDDAIADTQTALDKVSNALALIERREANTAKFEQLRALQAELGIAA